MGKPVSEGRRTGRNHVPSAGQESGDERLVADLRRHAPGSLARLHRLYAVGIYNLALRMVHRREDAEDITHDVLIRAYERLPRDREVRLRPWLYRITLNRCYDHLRAAARRRPAEPDDHAHDVPAIGDPFEQAELGALFERALETMSARQQAALLLKDVHGFSTVELAAMLEVTPGSAEVLLARARTSFRARFADIAGVEQRSLPAWIGAGLIIPFVGLPAGLLSPPAPPVSTLAPAHPLPDLTHAALGGGYAGPVGVAGGGLGSAIANSAALKLAVVVAAAATMTAGVSDVRHVAHRPPRSAPPAAAVTRPSHVAATQTGTAAVASVVRHAPRPVHSATPAVTTATPSATPVAASPAPVLPSPSPSPSSTGLGDIGYTPPPSASASPTPTPSPSDTTTPSPTPSASPTAGDTPTPSASPTL